MISRFQSIVLISLVLLAGCGGDDLGRKEIPRAKSPPKFPAKVETPLDNALQDQAKNQIMIAFSSTDPVLKSHAIEAMVDVMPDGHTNDIWGALKDPDPLVRFAAVMAAGQLKLADAKPELQQLVDDTQAPVRVAAIYALHQLGDYSYSKELERYAQDENADVRGDTAWVLGLIGDPSALNILNVMKRDRNTPVRLQVAESMWRLGSEEGRDMLIAGTVSANPAYQMVAMMGLGSTKNSAIRAHIRADLTADYPEVCLVAARIMGDLGSDEGYGVAMTYLKVSDPRQRALAALAFGSIGRNDAQPYLVKLLADQEPEVKIAAATGILKLAKRAGP